jgi:hypothetical protein
VSIYVSFLNVLRAANSTLRIAVVIIPTQNQGSLSAGGSTLSSLARAKHVSSKNCQQNLGQNCLAEARYARKVVPLVSMSMCQWEMWYRKKGIKRYKSESKKERKRNTIGKTQSLKEWKEKNKNKKREKTNPRNYWIFGPCLSPGTDAGRSSKLK